MMMPQHPGQQAIQCLKQEEQQQMSQQMSQQMTSMSPIIFMNPQTGAPMHVSALPQMAVSAGYAMPAQMPAQMPAGPGQLQAGHVQTMVPDPAGQLQLPHPDIMTQQQQMAQQMTL